MKIAYIFTLDPNLSTGIFKKIKSQIRYWQAAGHTVCAFHVRPVTSNFSPLSLDGLKKNWRAYVYSLGLSGIVNRINTWQTLANDVIRWDPDIAYYRYSRFWPGLGKLARYVPLVTELNTVEREYFDRSKKWYLYHKLNKIHFFRQVSGIICVTNEICRQYSKNQYPGMRRVIANGIDLNKYETLPPSNSETPVLVFIGHVSPWHGVDKILKLAELHPKWTIHIVGEAEDYQPIEQDNVIFHGVLDREEYKQVFQKADVGIGSLAMHRNYMQEACPLKVREYLAYGLPVIIGYDDTDFRGNEPFILQVPNQKNNIKKEIERIEHFVERWCSQRVSEESISQIDVQQKESQRIEFFQSVSQR